LRIIKRAAAADFFPFGFGVMVHRGQNEKLQELTDILRERPLSLGFKISSFIQKQY